MVYSLVVPGGIGDLIAVSAVARTMQKRGHHVFVHVWSEGARIEAASHLDGFDGWAIQRVDPQDAERSPSALTWDGRRAAMLLPDAQSPLPRLGYIKNPDGSRLQAVARSLDFVTNTFEQPLWHVQQWELVMAREWLWSVFSDGSAPVIYVGNLGSMQQRSLPTDRTVELCAGLTGRGFNVVLNQATEKLHGHIAAMERVVLASALPFPIRAGVISESAFCVSVDTGVLHMSVAVSTPVVAICGPFTFDHVCRHYAKCLEAPVTKRASCYGCRLIPGHGLSERCEVYGCKSIAALDVPKTVNLVADYTERGSSKMGGAAVRHVGRKANAKNPPRSPLCRSSRRKVVLSQAGDPGGPTVLVTGADVHMQKLSSRLVARLRSMTDLPVVDISPLANWGLLSLASWVKAWIWDFLPRSVERVLWLDADVFPVGRIERIPDVQLGFVLDPWDGKEDFEEECRIVPSLAECNHYFNCGVFVAERSHTEPIFYELRRHMLDQQVGRLMEQAWFNIISQQSGLAAEIPLAWNWLVGRCPAPEDVVIAHMSQDGQHSARRILPLLYNLCDQDDIPQDREAVVSLIETEYQKSEEST